MRDIRIEKIVLNIGCGSRVPVENAKTILERLAGKKAVITKTHKRTTFGMPKNKPIGCKVTIRKNCEEFLRKLILAKGKKLSRKNFDNNGNFSFGIEEYIDAGLEYDPKIGMLGFDVSVVLERPGFRVKRKKLSKKIGKKHLISKEEGINFVKEKFGVDIE